MLTGTRCTAMTMSRLHKTARGFGDAAAHPAHFSL